MPGSFTDRCITAALLLWLFSVSVAQCNSSPPEVGVKTGFPTHTHTYGHRAVTLSGKQQQCATRAEERRYTNTHTQRRAGNNIFPLADRQPWKLELAGIGVCVRLFTFVLVFQFEFVSRHRSAHTHSFT